MILLCSERERDPRRSKPACSGHQRGVASVRTGHNEMTVTFPSADSATFEPNVDSVRRARRLIRDVVFDAGGDADAAELLTAELATNAVMHA